MATLNNLTINSTGAVTVAQGTTAQIPATAIRWTTGGFSVLSGTTPTLTNNSWSCPSGITQIEVLVVGAGGGTGFDVGGGGGGGGVIYRAAYPTTPGNVYSISVGVGGASGQTAGVNGTNGSNTTFDTLVALGGGGGGSYPGTGNANSGGASGGGGGDNYDGAIGFPGQPVPDQGFVGGRSSPSNWGSGAGGGAGGAGFPNYGANTTYALGGRPLFYNISGTREGYGGGGYGSPDSGAVYVSGRNYSNLVVGTYGFGANGTGSPNASPYSGANGCVIIRYSSDAVAQLRYNTTNNIMETVVRGRPFSPLGLKSSNPAASAQEILDNYPEAASGVYWIDNGLSVVQVYCEFVDGDGWMMAGNIQSENYNVNGSFSWNDYPNWMQDGSSLGSVTNPYGTVYRNQDVWRYQPARKIRIKSHNHGSEFGSGSWASWPLLANYAGKTLKELFRNYDQFAGAGGIQISGTFDKSIGYGKTRYAAGLWKDPIARSITNNKGHLRINHALNNNGVRLLCSEQYLETSNTDRTRGLGCAFAIAGTSLLNTDGSNYNSIVGPYVEDDGTGSGNHQFANGIFPDNTNANARATQWNNQPRWIHYAIFIK
jgi:hypothetical protein